MHAFTSFKWLSLVFPAVHAQGFTFPTQQITFLVGDLVNITWDVPSAQFSLYEICFTLIPLQCTSPYSAFYLTYKPNTNYPFLVWQTYQTPTPTSGTQHATTTANQAADDDDDDNSDDDTYAYAYAIVCGGIDGDGNSCDVEYQATRYIHKPSRLRNRDSVLEIVRTDYDEDGN
ncbi:Hypothetical protein PENO1_103840 [Penicillium occitanis (nom. inval.)]|nr:Hypothetical protein PENO1_103840 [Penicillium occitanis (nom. inval.)]PCG89934.1 hypothetical protein PENOC_104390 [Penicillium occitanis (nom. inval.)]